MALDLTILFSLPWWTFLDVALSIIIATIFLCFLWEWSTPQYARNRPILCDRLNLTVYADLWKVVSDSDEPLERYPLFSDMTRNVYFWQVATRISDYFYTRTDNEEDTMSKIYATCFGLRRDQLADDFIECCLLSYFTQERLDDCRRLAWNRKITLNGITVYTRAYIEGIGRDLEGELLSADVMLICDGKQVIIATYNGRSGEEMQSMLNMYQSALPLAQVYVVTCNFVDPKRRYEDSFMLWTKHGETFQRAASINIGDREVFSIEDFHQTYYKTYMSFKAELSIWLMSQQVQRIFFL